MSDADTLEIKKRARRRLVGAVALALLAAIVLPMMMDEEPHPSIQDIQISIPDRDAAGVPRRAAPAAESVPAAVVVPEEDEAVASEKPAGEQAESAPGAVAAQAARPAPAPAAPAAATPPRSAETRAPAPAAESRPARPAADEEARVRALIEGKTPPAQGDAFVLQIGAFSDAAKAARLADELRARGFQAYTERAGSVTRVRVGPVNGRVAADTLAARLKAAGHPAVLQPR